MRRVVITGVGALGATGNDLNTLWENINQGNSGIAPIQQWDASHWEYHLAAEIKNYNPRSMLKDHKLLKVITRQDVIGLNAAQQAIEHSQLLPYRDTLTDPSEFNDRSGVYIASPGVKFNHLHELLPLFKEAAGDIKKFGEKLFDCVHPMWLLRILSNNVLAYVGIQNNFKGPNHNIPNHGISGTQAIAEAARAIKNNTLDRAIVVGYETAVEPQACMYYARIGTLSKTGLRPFNRDHDGTVLAEAGAAMMLESLESARARNATIYAEILGDAFSSEAKGVFSIREDGDGVQRMLKNLLGDIKLSADSIGMISAHGNANAVSDISEAKAIAEVFGSNSVPVTAYKWSVGHSIAAAGVLETIFNCKALAEKCVPGIATLTKAAKACQVLNISSDVQMPRSNVAISITRGFGSLDGCLAIRGWDSEYV